MNIIFEQRFGYYKEHDFYVIFVEYSRSNSWDNAAGAGCYELCIVDNEQSAKAICGNLNQSWKGVWGRELYAN